MKKKIRGLVFKLAAKIVKNYTRKQKIQILLLYQSLQLYVGDELNETVAVGIIIPKECQQPNALGKIYRYQW